MRAPRGRSSVHGDYGLLESHHHDRAGSLDQCRRGGRIAMPTLDPKQRARPSRKQAAFWVIVGHSPTHDLDQIGNDDGLP